MVANQVANGAHVFLAGGGGVFRSGDEAQHDNHFRQQAVGHGHASNGERHGDGRVGVYHGLNVRALAVRFQVHGKFTGGFEGGGTAVSLPHHIAFIIDYKHVLRFQQPLVQTRGSDE